MTDTQNLKQLLDTLDELCTTLTEIERSKTSIIKSMLDAGARATTAINDFYQTVGRFTSQIDATVKEIKLIIENK